MKLAVISDIHGNLAALEAVLADLDGQQADQLVCLGDVASFGPQPKETLRRVKELNCPVIMGNADEELLDPPVPEGLGQSSETSTLIYEIASWCAMQLDKDDLAYLRSFQPTVELELDGIPLLAVHGSPKSYNDIIVASIPDDELGALLGDVVAKVVLGGHTHTQLLRRYRDISFVNPGSVGLPYEYPRGSAEAINPHWAEYAMIEVIESQPATTFRRVPYDATPLIKAVRSSDMPYQETWLEGWLHD